MGRGDCCWNGDEIRLCFGKMLSAGFRIFACPAVLGGSVNVWGTWCTVTGEGIVSGVVGMLLTEGRPCSKTALSSSFDHFLYPVGKKAKII